MSGPHPSRRSTDHLGLNENDLVDRSHATAKALYDERTRGQEGRAYQERVTRRLNEWDGRNALGLGMDADAPPTRAPFALGELLERLQSFTRRIERIEREIDASLDRALGSTPASPENQNKRGFDGSLVDQFASLLSDLSIATDGLDRQVHRLHDLVGAGEHRV